MAIEFSSVTSERRSATISGVMIQRGLWVILITAIWVSQVSADGELPPKLEQDLTRAKEAYRDEFKAANEALSEACGKAIENLRKSSKLSGDPLVKAIESLEAERVRFDKFGRVPLSQPMRSATVLYLKRIQKAEITLSKVYDSAIAYYTKKKQDDDAKQLVADKDTVIVRNTVIHLQRLDTGVVWTLLSDGTDGPRTWSIDAKSLVVKYHDAARAFTLTYTCQVQANGTVFDCTQHDGYKFRAVLVEPENTKN